jgi:hypothetical protein
MRKVSTVATNAGIAGESRRRSHTEGTLLEAAACSVFIQTSSPPCCPIAPVLVGSIFINLLINSGFVFFRIDQRVERQLAQCYPERRNKKVFPRSVDFPRAQISQHVPENLFPFVALDRHHPLLNQCGPLLVTFFFHFFYLTQNKKHRPMRRLANTRGQNEVNIFERTRIAPPSPVSPPTDATPGSHAALLANKSYVLYVKPNDSPSRTAYDLAVPLFDIVYIQDTTQMRVEERPAFLRGVPTLVDVNRREAYPGRLCLQELEKLLQKFSPFSVSEELGGTVVSADPFAESPPDHLGPQGIDAGILGNYASCDMTQSDSALYQTGRRRKEDIDGVIGKLMEERSSSEKPKGEPTAAEMSRILASMLEV